MIYSTNRTTSVGDITVDVNESYFGVGALDFMQENAQDELALFEAAIKSDIDEVMIGESATELEALNESFVQSAANKIKEMMRKFIEWLQGSTRSAIAKLTQLLVRDNAQFIKAAKKRIMSMPNAAKFKYAGKALNIGETTKIEAEVAAEFKLADEDLYKKAEKATTKEAIDAVNKEIEDAVEKFKAKKVREDFNEKIVITVKEEDGKGLDFVQKHLDLLATMDKKSLSDLKKHMKEMEANAKKMAKEAEAKAKAKTEDEVEKNRLAAMAKAAAAYRDCCQTHVKDTLYIISQQAKIARAVVAKAMGASPKNEGAEDYSEELVQAMIEAADYEYDEALEEMSEAKECDYSDIEDIEDEE